VLGDTVDEAEAKLRDMVASRGMDPAMLDDPAVRGMLMGRIVVGDAEAATARLRDAVGCGLDGIIVNLPAEGGDAAAVRDAAAVVRATVGT